MHGFQYTIKIPTRVTEYSESAIDNFITNIDSKFFKVDCLITALSDHDGQLFNIFNSKSKNNISLKIHKFERRFKQESIKHFIYDLSKEDWTKLYNCNVEDKFTYFYNVLKYYFDLHFPKTKIVTSNVNNRWIDDEIINEHNQIIAEHHLYREDRSNVKLKNCIKERKKRYRKMIQLKKKKHFNNKIRNSTNINKTVWQIVNTETKGKKEKVYNNITLKHNGLNIEDPYAVSNILNDNFADMVENHVLPNLKKVHTSSENFSLNIKFKCQTIDEPILTSIIDSLKPKWSSGYDEIPIKIIKESKSVLLKPLLHVINTSLITGVYPAQLKISKIIPVYKKGEKKDPLNYRPLAIQPALSKLFEKSILFQLVDYFENNNLLDKEQHGYRKNKSTTTALISYVENVLEKLDEDNKVVGAFLDMSKAFDSVHHLNLLHKLKMYGICGKELSWIKSYLEGRQQFVNIVHLDGNKMYNIKSNVREVKYSVPQGSVLGPFLFLCYLGGMPKHLSEEVDNNALCLYADDISMAIYGKNIELLDIKIRDSLLTIKDYLNEKNLLLNENKTTFIKFECKNSRKELFDNFVYETKFLGLTLDSTLNWTTHVDNICNKISSGIFAIRRLYPLCSREILRTVYFANIHSHISYGIEIYGGTSKFNLNKILHLQKEAIRCILNLNKNESCKNHFRELDFLTVYSLYIYKTILYVKNVESQLQRQQDIHKYNTRNKQNFIIKKHKKEKFKETTNYIGVKFMHSLPCSIRSEENLKKFKNKLKVFLIDAELYNLEDFITQ